VKTSNLTGL